MIEPKNKITKTDILGLLKHMFLLSLPIFSILSTHLLQSTGNNTLIMIIILIIAIFPIIIVINYFEEKLYLLAIVSISLSLLYLTSSNYSYLWGNDIHKEYYYASITQNNNWWNSEIRDKFNAMLSVVILAPAYSLISSMPLMTVFKYIYPLLYSIVPLILYLMFKEQFNPKIAFLGVFFFISTFTFFTEMIGLARQQIGEIAFVLIIYLLTTKNLIKYKKLLIYFFITTLTLSHYVLTYMFIIISFLSIIISNIQQKIEIKILKEKFEDTYLIPNLSIIRGKNNTIIVALFSLIIATSWYLYTSNSVIFQIVVNLFDQIIYSVFNEFFNPRSTQALYIFVSSQKTLLHDITKIVHIIMQMLITIGLINTLFNKIKEKLSYDYVTLSYAGYIIALSAIIVPFFSSAINTTRIYHILLVFLAPFSVIGLSILYDYIHNIIITKNVILSQNRALQIFSIFASIFLLFNTGFFYEIYNVDKSLADPYWALANGNERDRLVLYNSYTPVEEIQSIRWLSSYRIQNIKIFSDDKRSLNAYGLIPPEDMLNLWQIEDSLESKYYTYLRKFNIIDGLITGWTGIQGLNAFNSSDTISRLNEDSDLIYSNGNSIIFLSRTR